MVGGNHATDRKDGDDQRQPPPVTAKQVANAQRTHRDEVGMVGNISVKDTPNPYDPMPLLLRLEGDRVIPAENEAR